MVDQRDPQQPDLLDSLGRRHQRRTLAAAERRAAARRAFEALPADEREAIWQRVDRLLFREAIWRQARTYAATNPHSYTKRKDWRDDRDFRFVVEFFDPVSATARSFLLRDHTRAGMTF